MFRDVESSAIYKCPDFAVTIQHNVGGYAFVIPGHNTGVEDVGATYWRREDASYSFVPPLD